MDRSKKSVDAVQLTTNHQLAHGSQPITHSSPNLSSKPAIVSPESLVLTWDGSNYSCAYDSLFTMLFGIWNEKPVYWNKIFKNHSVYVQELAKGFQQIRSGGFFFGDVQNNVRNLLHHANPMSFPNGHQFASVNELIRVLFDTKFPSGWIACPSCHRRQAYNTNSSLHFDILPSSSRSISEWAHQNFLFDNPPICLVCDSVYSSQIHFPKVPHIVSFDIASMPLDFLISDIIKIKGNSRNTTLKLKGIFYFTMQMFESSGEIWFHDGQRNAGKVVDASRIDLVSYSASTNLCCNKKALIAIYCH